MYFDQNTTVYILCGFGILSRVSDIVTTRLASPSLSGEINPLARKLGWKYIVLTILVGFLPLYDVNLGITLTTASFLVAFSNAAKLLQYRQLGENGIEQIFRSSIRARGVFFTWFIMSAPAIIASFIGVLLKVAEGRYWNNLLSGVINGFFIYSFIVLIYTGISVFKYKYSVDAQ